MNKPEHTFDDDDDVDLDTEVVIVDGKRFTEQDAEELAADLSGRDRSNANLIPGRKSMSGAGKHSPVLNVRLPADTRAEFDTMAHDTDVKPSKLARSAIDDALGYFVYFEQSFDGGHFEWVRIDKLLSPQDAVTSFENYVRIAPSVGFRSVQIRRGREQVIQSWPEAV